MLPRDIAARLGDERFTRFYVSARLKQMNKKLEALSGKHVAEKRGLKAQTRRDRLLPVEKVGSTRSNQSELQKIYLPEKSSYLIRHWRRGKKTIQFLWKMHAPKGLHY
jgi:hypothetical protein